MQHMTKEEIAARGTVYRIPGAQPKLSKSARLRRWAGLLRRQADGIAAFHETEYVTAERRMTLRREGSAVAVAYADPVLREDGLSGDTYGAAQKYFDLTDNEMHAIVCSCICGRKLPSAFVARVVGRMSYRYSETFAGRAIHALSAIFTPAARA